MAGAFPIWIYGDKRIHDLPVASNDGRLIGYFHGKPIFEAVYDSYGYRYAYVGVAPRLGNGRIDLGCLRTNQWVVEPGLLYEWDCSGAQRRQGSG